jgi:hypothetical protein
VPLQRIVTRHNAQMGLRNRLMSLDRRVLRGNYPLQTNDETTDQYLQRLTHSWNGVIASLAIALVDTRQRLEALEARLGETDQ